jgi:hypothetical protein
MFVFVWKSEEHYGTRSKAFMSEADAWDDIKDTCVNRWPDFVLSFAEGNDVAEIEAPINFVTRMLSKQS